jgi:hypothetical protein
VSRNAYLPPFGEFADPRRVADLAVMAEQADWAGLGDDGWKEFSSFGDAAVATLAGCGVTWVLEGFSPRQAAEQVEAALRSGPPTAR